MDGDRSVVLMENQPVFEECHYELRRLIELHGADVLPHPVQAGALVAEHRPPAIFRGFQQGIFELFGLLFRDVRHSFALPHHPAAEFFHAFREYHLVARFVKKRGHLLDQRLVRCRFMTWQAHHLVETGWEIDDLGSLCHPERSEGSRPERTRCGRSPEGESESFVEPLT